MIINKITIINEKENINVVENSDNIGIKIYEAEIIPTKTNVEEEKLKKELLNSYECNNILNLYLILQEFSNFFLR